MTLSPSASIHSHRVDVSLSPVEPLSMVSHHLFAIFILAETIEMKVRERTTVDKIKKCKSPLKHLWLTASRVDSGLKDRVLGGSL
jgi:hypothetical protein